MTNNASHSLASSESDTPCSLTTRVTQILGTRVPLIQGGMAWVANAQLAAAVSNAGGLGVIACGSAPVSWVEEQVALARTLTSGPLGVNLMLMSPEAPAIAQKLPELGVDVVTTGAGSPSSYMEAWKEAGIKVLPVVASASMARRMERCGADAVIAEGCEAGGHIGELTTMALTPAVCDAVSIPVIAAGGIADGRGMAAAFALGAEGVQVGTRFLTAKECTISQAYKDKVIAAKDSDTVVTGRSGGAPVRGLKNKFARTVRAHEGAGDLSPEELEAFMAGSLRKAVEGDAVNGSLMAGQVACLVHDELSCQEIIDMLVMDAQKRLGRSLEQMASDNAERTWY